MKTKNSDIAVKIFLVVVAVILVGVIIAWSTGVFKDKRNDLNEGTERINNAISTMAEFDLLTYDNGSITGSLLVDLIERVRKEGLEISVLVKTNVNSVTGVTYTSADTPVLQTSKIHADYINPNGVFEGSVDRNDNGIISLLTFTQVKR